jgi:hypothetical protein
MEPEGRTSVSAHFVGKAFSLHSNMTESIPWQDRAIVVAQVCLPFLEQLLRPSWVCVWGPHLLASSNPNYLSKAILPNAINT